RAVHPVSWGGGVRLFVRLEAHAEVADRVRDADVLLLPGCWVDGDGGVGGVGISVDQGRRAEVEAGELAALRDRDALRGDLVPDAFVLPQHELAEVALLTEASRALGVDVGDRAAADRRPGRGVVEGRARWLDDVRAEQAVAPGLQRVHVVVEE